ncbi:MAG TPA: MerR family transcriptional regulator [Pseudonocardia sp.]|nr:MerR family transcriptional regulator [Pseudonocardia sp.]
MTAASSAEAEQLTIDQLASRSGISVRTIRFYAGKGLLPPPKLRGRLGLYGPDHLTRLDLISELTGLGFTLTAIEGFLAALPESIAVEDLVLQRALLAPWVPEKLECISRTELDRRAGRTLTDEEIASLEALGVLERRREGLPERSRNGDARNGDGPSEGDIMLHGAAILSSALASLDIGMQPEVLRRSHELISQHTAALAEDLMKMFQEEILQPYRDRGRPVTERARLRELFTRLKPIAVQGVVTAFGRAVNRTIRERYTDPT